MLCVAPQAQMLIDAAPVHGVLNYNSVALKSQSALVARKTK